MKPGVLLKITKQTRKATTQWRKSKIFYIFTMYAGDAKISILSS
jgi:hypothetical protein